MSIRAASSDKGRPIQVFLSVRFVRKRGTRIVRYRSEWIARGTGCVMYRSKVVDTSPHDARMLALRFLGSKRGEGLVDTSHKRL